MYIAPLLNIFKIRKQQANPQIFCPNLNVCGLFCYYRRLATHEIGSEDGKLITSKCMGYIIHSNKKCCMCTNESSHMERSQHDYPMNTPPPPHTHTHTHTNHHNHHHHPCDDYDSWKEISEQGSIAIHDIVTGNSYFRQQSSNRGPLSTFWHQSGTIVILPIGYLGNDSFHSTHKSCDK